MKVNDMLKQFEQQGGDIFSFKENENRFRVLVDFVPYESEFKGKKRTRFITRIIDRADGKIKLAFFPFTITKFIGDYQENPEYKFDAFPMPYDFIITAKNAGTIDVEYTPGAARTNSPVTPEEQTELAKQKTLEEVILDLRAKETGATLQAEDAPLPTEPGAAPKAA